MAQTHIGRNGEKRSLPEGAGEWGAVAECC